ncbi:MAG: SBBP repeat-containing protein, partial [Bacteroidota bacterium]
MAIRLFTLFALILSLARLQAQGWEAIYGGSGQDVARGIARTADGGYVVTGYYNANSRLFLFKIDADGNLQWSRTYTGGAPSARIEGAGVAVDPDGDIFVAGYVDADGTSGPLQRDIYLMKTDPFGVKIWGKTYGDDLIEEAMAIKRLDDGNLILAGVQHKPGNKQNVFVMKTDADGTLQWLNNYGNDEYRKQGNGITISPLGDILIAGESQVTAIADRQAYVLHLKADGVLVGEQTYGTPDDEIASAVEFTPAGNLVLGGFSNSVPGGAGYLLEITPGLNAGPVWEKFIDGTDINDLAVEPGGNLLLTGHRVTGVLEDLNIIKTDPQGNIIWEARN